MKLGEFLTNAPPATGSAKKEKVEFTLLGRNSSAAQVETTGFACFALVTDKDHEEADLLALKSLRETSQDMGGVVPQNAMSVRERAQFLSAALRNWDDPRERFATADELQRHVSRTDLERIEREYHQWVAKHYPTRVTREDRQALKHEAVGK